MTFIDMNGLDWSQPNEGGIYLMGHDTSESEVARGGGGLLRSQKIKGWTGKFIPGDVKTSADAIVASGLDFMVDRHPIVRLAPIAGIPTSENPSGIIGWEPQTNGREKVNGLPTGGYDVVDSHVMNVRRDTGSVLGVVGKNWRGPQNDEAFKFVDDLVDDGSAKWLAGGTIGGGKKVWMCAQLGREVLLGGDLNEASIPLMFIANGWDGGTSYTITAAPYRRACRNGQTIPLEGFVRTWRARHTSGLTMDKRLLVARKTLELQIAYFDNWAVEMERLMLKPISTREVEQAVVKLFPDPKPAGEDGNLTDRQIRAIEKKRLAVLDTYRDTPNLQHLGHSAYRFLNAVTDYADWQVKCDEDEQMLSSAEPNPLKDLAYALVK